MRYIFGYDPKLCNLRNIFLYYFHHEKLPIIHRHQLANLAIFFRNQQVETITRMEASTYTDFWAVCGGLLGLFLGVSALSIIEFIYYSTLRLFWNLRQLRSKNVIEPFRRQNHVQQRPPNYQ